MRIKRFNDMSLELDITSCFINHMSHSILERNRLGKTDLEEPLRKIIKDLKINFNLVATFGTGITALYPIISDLITNSKLNIEVTPERILLLTIASVFIVHLEEKKVKGKEEEKLRKDCRTMLEELKLSGIGNGIVKKFVDVIKSIKSIFDLIGKHCGSLAGNIIDMFGYTALLVPILNGLDAVVGKYDLNMETLPGNFLSIAVGVGTVVAKHGIAYILDKIKLKINKKQIIDELETPTIQKIGNFVDTTKDVPGDLIKEQ